ncbi:MAG: hypothetical protein M5U34_42730 [Chloroflexi bacterium]|nr:hypothetical protein [Chloroflexota bacterium]
MIGPFGFHPNKTMRSRALGLARPLSANGHAVKIFCPPGKPLKMQTNHGKKMA